MRKKGIQLIRTYWEIVVLFTFSLLPFLWLSGGRIILGHDSGFRLDPVGQLSTLFYSWYTKWNFGMDLSLYKGFLVIQFPEIFFTFLTGSVLLGQQMATASCFFLIGFSIYALIKTLYPDPKYWILRMYVSLFYMYNFFVLQAWFIAERAKFSVYAALPLYIAVLHRIFTGTLGLPRAVLYVSLISFFLNGGGSPPLCIPMLLSVFLAYIIYSFWYMRIYGLAGLWYCLKIGILFSLCYLLVNMYWILPLLDLYTRNFSSTLTGQGGIEGVLSWERMISKNSSFLNIIRLQGMPDWYDNTTHPFANEFFNNPILIASSFVPIIFVLLGFVLKMYQKQWKEKPVVFFTIILLCIGVFFSMGTHGPIGIVYEKLMRYLPGFTIFRSSFYKFAPLVWFAMIVLSGIAVQEIIMKYIKNRFFIIVCGVFVSAGVLLYHYPFFVRDIFQFGDGFTTRLSVPSWVSEMNSFINENSDSGRNILVLPELNTGYYGKHIDSYTWGYFSIELLPREARRTFVANDDGSPEIITSLYRTFYENDKKAFLDIASILGIRYILWRGDVKYNSAVVGLHNPQESKNIIYTFGFPLVFKSGEWELYDISGLQDRDMVRVYTNIESSYDQNFTAFDAWIRNVKDSKDTAVLSHIPEKHKDTVVGFSDGVLYEPVCMLCAENEFEQTIHSLTLPKPATVFSKWRMRIMGSDEQMRLNKENNPGKRIDIHLSFMSRLVAEYIEGNKTALDLEYKNSLSDVYIQLEKITGVERNKYRIRVLMYLMFHKKEIEKYLKQSEISQYLTDGISDISQKAHYTKNSGTYIYGIDVLEEKEYVLYADMYIPEIDVDGSVWKNGTAQYLSRGYHELTVSGAYTKAPKLSIAVKADAKGKLGMPVITYEQINPVRYVVHIQNAHEPFMLVLRQQFDPGWVSNVSGVHMMANGFENGWLIDKQGSYDVVLSYVPQQSFYRGLGITGIAMCVIFIQFFLFFRIKRKK